MAPNSTMASLSHDMFLDVLCCLGVKDLLRFRCVSKPFCSSIDDPVFSKLHCSHSLKTNSNRIIIFRSVRRNNSHTFQGYNLYSVNFDSLETARKLNHPLDVAGEGRYTEIVGSCHGLLVLCDKNEDISLWNPSIRRSLMLRVTEIEVPPSGDFLIESLVYGFGYDPISDDYKLVRVVQFVSLDSEVKVYSLKTNSWRRMKDFPFHLKYYRAAGVLANNALHWVVSENPKPDCESFGFVVALDLVTEEYHVVELPGGLDNFYHMNLRPLGGCLSLIVNYWPPLVTDIWMMKEYGVKESWTKLMSLKQSESIPAFKCVLPLAFSKNGDKVLLEFNDKKLFWYDITSKRVDRVRIGGVPSRFEAEMLVESLVPLNDNAAMIHKEEQPSKKKQKKRDDFLSKGFHLVL